MNATSTSTGTSTDADTVRIPRQEWEIDTISRAPGRGMPDREVVSPRPVLDAARLWSGGLASAVVAALVGLVGMLVVRVLLQVAPSVAHDATTFGASATVLLCLTAAGAALAATGLAHLLVISTPRPLAYLGWIIGLATAVATVLPLVGGLPLATAAAEGAVRLVIGLAVGSLVAGATAAAIRPGRTNSHDC